MIRVTVSRSLSDEWRSRKPSSLFDSPTVRRIYRWNSIWATPSKAESRSTVLETADYLVEHCIPTDSPVPFEIDDIWEEEVVLLPNIEYTGLLSLIGTPLDIAEVLRREGLPVIPIPAVKSPNSGHTHPTQIPKSKPKTRCMIED